MAGPAGAPRGIDPDEEAEFVVRCRVPPAHSVDNAQAEALFALAELTPALTRAVPCSAAYHLGLAWVFRFSDKER